MESSFYIYLAVAFLVGVVLTTLVGSIIYLLRRRSGDVKQNAVSAFSKDESSSKPWEDIEKGLVKEDKAPTKENSKASLPDLCAALRNTLDGDRFKGDINELRELQCYLATITGDRLNGSSPKVVNAEALRAAATLLEVDRERAQIKDTSKGLTVETRTPTSSDRSGSCSSPRHEDLPGVITAPSPPPSPSMQDLTTFVATPPPSPSRKDIVPPRAAPIPLVNSGPPKEFGPTDRQLELVDPPEKHFAIDEEESHHSTLTTLQKILGKRDAQTTELHRQLRTAREHLWQHAAESRAATARLESLLSDPSRAPLEQAEMIESLRGQVKDLSSKLADAKQQAQHWSGIAKRQRAFFMQSERMSPESMLLLRKHPAGDIFLAPQPVVLEDEDGPEELMWDVGTSHCNPYAVDSWPFEPNVLAQRASARPNLNRWEEGDLEDEYEEECDDEVEEQILQSWARREARTAPSSSSRGDEDPDSPESPGKSPWSKEADGQRLQRHGTLPPLPVSPGSETSRSF